MRGTASRLNEYNKVIISSEIEGYLILESKGTVNGATLKASDEWVTYTFPINGEITFQTRGFINQNEERHTMIRNVRVVTDLQFYEQPSDLILFEGSGENWLTARLHGSHPDLTFKWYRDDTLIDDAAVYSQYSTSTLELNYGGSGFVGKYYCVATLSDGTQVQSKTATVTELKNVGHILDTSSTIKFESASASDFSFDDSVFHNGNSSLFFIDDRLRLNKSITLRIPSGDAFSFWMKTEGLSPSNTIRVSSPGVLNRRTLDSSHDWTQYEVGPNTSSNENYIHFSMSFFDQSSAKLWIDDLQISKEPTFLTPVESIKARIGESITLKANASSKYPITYVWNKEGIPIKAGKENTFQIEKLQFKDLATYSVIVKNEYGQIDSGPISIDLIEDFGNAVEMENIRFQTSGTNPWDIENIESVDGSRSLKSGQVSKNETSNLSFYVIGPIDVGFNLRKPRWQENPMLRILVNDEILIGQLDVYENWEFRKIRINSTGPTKVTLQVFNETIDGSPDNYILFDRLQLHSEYNYTYSNWLSTFNPDSNLTSPSAIGSPFIDTDKDGIANGLEYMFGSDPRVFTAHPTISLDHKDSEVYLHVESLIRISNEFSVMLQKSTDFKNWTDWRPSHESPSDLNPALWKWTWTTPPGELEQASSWFYRWKLISEDEGISVFSN